MFSAYCKVQINGTTVVEATGLPAVFALFLMVYAALTICQHAIVATVMTFAALFS